MTETNTRTIDAVETACAIMDTLEVRGPSGVTELAHELDLPKSVVHSHLRTLTDCEYAVKEDTDYQLSFRHLNFARHVKEQFGSYEVITKEVDEIAKETGEISQFATEEHGKVVYLAKAREKTGVQTRSSVGKREYLHSTSLGKAILSQLSQETVEEIVGQQGMPRKTENTITDIDELFEELERTRDRGYAIDNEENISGLRCVAAPVGGPDDSILGAVSISGPSRRMEDDRIESELSDTVTRAANVIEINAKFS